MLKKRYLFLIIITCLLAISAVSAEDNSTSDIISVSNDVNSLETNCNMNSIVNETDTLKVSNDEVLTAGNNWYVNGSKTSSGDGKSDAGAFKTLNEALNKASNDDTIMIASGTYKGTYNTGLEFSKNLNFIKYGDGEAIFDAESQRRIWTITTTSINITGLTFKNGKTSNGGGAIYFNYSCGSVTNCTFTENTANSIGDGGAIYFNYSCGSVTNCTFTENTAPNEGGGGAIFFCYNSGGSVTNCTFIGNRAKYGGAIRLDSGGNVTNCTFTENTVGNDGGAICLHSGGNVTNCTFTHNAAWSSGGAIYFCYKGGSVTNCTFTENTANYGDGGAIHLDSGGNVTNCTFTGNTAMDGEGGAIYFYASTGSVTNCTFIGNGAEFGGAIEFMFNSGSVTDCAFDNNYANQPGDAIRFSGRLGCIENNWWGSNNPDWAKLIYAKGTVTSPASYAILNVTADPNEISSDKTSAITTKFVWNGTNTDATSSLPKRNVKLTSNGTLTETEGNVGLTSQFSATANGIYYVNANVDNEILGVNVKVTVIPNVIIDAPDVTKYYGGSERFSVTLKYSNGNPIANANIKITINGQTYTKTTDSNGETSMGINLNSGVYDVTTEYNGTKVHSTVTIKDTVIAKDVTKIYRNGTQYQGTFVDSKGNLIRNTDIRININGVFYTRTTDSKGMAQMNINLPPGTYILTAINPSNGEQHTTTVTVLPNIVENYDVTKYYKNASQYSLRLLDDKGNPVGAGVSIQLNINGVFYTRTSDANGYVKMNINLPPGTYIITAEYKGLRASNTIKVLSVLETKDLVMKYRDGSKFEAKILDGQGRPYAGQTVTFNINGVFYTKTTEADGIARLKINLLAGEYIITSMYNGLNAANKVIINNLKSPEEQYKDLLGPHGANGYVYYPDGTYEHFVNDIVVDGTHYVDKSY